VDSFVGAVLSRVFVTGVLRAHGISLYALPGLLQGDVGVFLCQCGATEAVAIYSFGMSYVLCKILPPPKFHFPV
jgi:hypothetical protein